MSILTTVSVFVRQRVEQVKFTFKCYYITTTLHNENSFQKLCYCQMSHLPPNNTNMVASGLAEKDFIKIVSKSRAVTLVN